MPTEIGSANELKMFEEGKKRESRVSPEIKVERNNSFEIVVCSNPINSVGKYGARTNVAAVKETMR